MRKFTHTIASSEAARILGLSRSQVNRLAATGRIPFVVKAPGVRGAYIFDRTDIEALLSPSNGDAA